MAKIYSPNKQYTGVSASVSFSGGVGETDKPHLIEWFRSHGYTVEDDRSTSLLDGMTIDELKAYAAEKKVDISGATSKKGIIKKIQEAEKQAS